LIGELDKAKGGRPKTGIMDNPVSLPTLAERWGNNQFKQVEVENFTPPLKGQKTRDVAASKAGVGLVWRF
jgi:hypothetical protein